MDRAASRRHGGIEIDFVNEDSRVHTPRKLAERSKVLLFGQRAARVVQVGDDDQPRSVGEHRGDLIRIDAKSVLALALEPFDLYPEEARGAEQWLIRRFLD